MLSIAVQFEELSITRTASITDEKLGVVMTMKIDAAEVAKVFSDLKLPAAFKGIRTAAWRSRCNEIGLRRSCCLDT